MQSRVINSRPTWKLNLTEPIASNYYPVNSRAFLRDSSGQRQLTIVTDRSCGGASVQSGSLEFLIHRRLLYDDNRGVSEPLNETGVDGRGLVVTVRHWIFLESSEKSAQLHRPFSIERASPVTVALTPLIGAPQDYCSRYRTTEAFAVEALPPNVNVLTIEARTESTMLLRLEHMYAVDEDASLSEPVILNLK
jgi:lysosomal alpha-mannosidase